MTEDAQAQPWEPALWTELPGRECDSPTYVLLILGRAHGSTVATLKTRKGKLGQMWGAHCSQCSGKLRPEDVEFRLRLDNLATQ